MMARYALMSFVQVADSDSVCKGSPNILDNKRGSVKYLAEPI
jgi:hypothetical protein